MQYRPARIEVGRIEKLPLPASIWPVAKPTKGGTGVAILVRQNLVEDTFRSSVLAFFKCRAGFFKLIWHDGAGLCMPIKRSEQCQLRGRSPTLPGGLAFPLTTG